MAQNPCQTITKFIKLPLWKLPFKCECVKQKILESMGLRVQQFGNVRLTKHLFFTSSFSSCVSKPVPVSVWWRGVHLTVLALQPRAGLSRQLWWRQLHLCWLPAEQVLDPQNLWWHCGLLGPFWWDQLWWDWAWFFCDFFSFISLCIQIRNKWLYSCVSLFECLFLSGCLTYLSFECHGKEKF